MRSYPGAKRHESGRDGIQTGRAGTPDERAEVVRWLESHPVPGKYVEALLPIFGSRLLFPREFVGRGDMSRGGLMLRCVDTGVPLTYVPLEGFVLAARAGARRVEGGPQTRRPYTAGLGFSFDRLSLDWAYEPYAGPGGAHRFGVRIQ